MFHVIQIMAECIIDLIVNCTICYRFYASLVTSVGAVV